MGISTETFSKIKLTCERCGHVWHPYLRDGHLPKKCPGCMSPYWDKPMTYPKISLARKAYFAARNKNKTE